MIANKMLCIEGKNKNLNRNNNSKIIEKVGVGDIDKNLNNLHKYMLEVLKRIQIEIKIKNIRINIF